MTGMTASCSTTAPETKLANQICIDKTILPVLDSILISRMKELNTEAAYGAVIITVRNEDSRFSLPEGMIIEIQSILSE